MPGREQYGPGDDAAAEWAKDMLEFTEDNFEDTGIEVRSMDKRDLEVGLFGDFLERVEHGKFVEWRANEEYGGLYSLEVVSKARARPRSLVMRRV